MSSSTVAAGLTGTFKGAASIAFRFDDFDQYQQAVLLYLTALGKPDPVPPKPDQTSYSIPISESMELLCAVQGPPFETNCTIVYWAVGTERGQIDEACNMLVAKGYKLLEAPGKSPLGNGDKEDTQRAVLQDKSGHRIGVIINPPVPFTGAAAPETSQTDFVIAPTHVINPPVTANGEG